MSTYYRGDRSRPAPPPLVAGTWLTPSAEVACWYGAAHRYDLPDDLVVLDLTACGVDGSEADLDVELADAGVEGSWGVAADQELYQLMERRDFLAACAAAGYDLVEGMQWDYDRGDMPYVAAIVTGRSHA